MPAGSANAPLVMGFSMGRETALNRPTVPTPRKWDGGTITPKMGDATWDDAGTTGPNLLPHGTLSWDGMWETRGTTTPKSPQECGTTAGRDVAVAPPLKAVIALALAELAALRRQL